MLAQSLIIEIQEWFKRPHDSLGAQQLPSPDKAAGQHAHETVLVYYKVRHGVILTVTDCEANDAVRMAQ